MPWVSLLILILKWLVKSWAAADGGNCKALLVDAD
jgi:hypothetical protein